MNGNKLNENMEEISKTIFSYCRAKTSSREDAEDLAQDIILELIKSSDSLRSDDAFYGFMWAVAGNVYKQWYRKSLKQSPVNLLKTFRKMTASAKAQMIFIFCGESLHCFRKSTAVQPLCIIFTDFPAVRYRPDCQHPKVWLNICFSSHEKY